MGSITLTASDGSQARIQADDGRVFNTPIPPNDGEVNAVYRALLAAGVVPASYTAPAAPIPDISDRQFARGLWGAGIISYSDFLGFIGPGSIPAAIQAIVNTLPDDDTGAPTQRKEAVGFLTGSKLYQFSHPLVEIFRKYLFASDPKWTVPYLTAQWTSWAAL